ncbi:MAG: M24 family metallopeptidase, partial [Halobacteriota archaeon]
ASGGVHLLVSSLEYGRARKESNAESVSRLVDYDFQQLAATEGRARAKTLVVASFLEDHGIERVAVPERFPLGTADSLREEGVEVVAESADVVGELRAVKSAEEIGSIRRAQAANEAAMAAAEDLLRASTVVDGVLTRDGDPLTSEDVAEEIEVTLLRHGCSLDETIVACGERAADPHDRGSGPLAADEAIIVDIFPREKASKYHADMTRTFLKGTPSDELCEWFDLTERALQAALDRIEPGVTGDAVHAAVCDVYEDAGHPTLRSEPHTETGFIHSTGHGVGLDVHELPRLAPDGGELEPGHVVTVEPGLYDPAVGGVRIEDLVVVTEDGYENLTEYPVELVVD